MFLRTFWISLAIAAFFVSSCGRSPDSETVANVALQASNREAKRLYKVEPFRHEHGKLRADDGHLFWEALTTSEGNDMAAKVKLDSKGGVLDVNVRMLVHPDNNSVPGLYDQLKPDTTRKPIPEIMPK